MKAEIHRRLSNVTRLREFFTARPNVWIDARDLEPIGGRQAWRTRVSELRVQLEKEGVGTIENRLIRRPLSELGMVVKSEYRYLPHQPLARDAAEYRSQPELF